MYKTDGVRRAGQETSWEKGPTEKERRSGKQVMLGKGVLGGRVSRQDKCSDRNPAGKEAEDKKMWWNLKSQNEFRKILWRLLNFNDYSGLLIKHDKLI